eukprot:3113533-Prymnesium_polylepis.1
MPRNGPRPASTLYRQRRTTVHRRALRHVGDGHAQSRDWSRTRSALFTALMACMARVGAAYACRVCVSTLRRLRWD